MIWAVIPVKNLKDSKSRLARLLTSEARSNLTQTLLLRTMKQLATVPDIEQICVVSPDETILTLASAAGARPLAEPPPYELNQALAQAITLASETASGILILPSDLPYLKPADIYQMITSTNLKRPLLQICSDYTGQGTNALYFTPTLPFLPRFGPDSFQLHLAEAARTKRHCRQLTLPGIQFDLDTEADWAWYSRR